MDLIVVAFKLSLIGSFIYLDRTHAMQVMISRPVVTAPIIGFFAGNPAMGLLVGAIIELLWIREIPVGAFIPPDETTLAILAASVGALGFSLDARSEFALYVFAIIIFLPAAYLSVRLDMALRTFNNRLWRNAYDAVQNGKERRVAAFHWTGAIAVFVVYFIMFFVFLAVGLNIIRFVFPLFPPQVKTAFFLTGCAVPVVGIAGALTTARGRWTLAIFSSVFLVLFILF
jgi:mannose/fructose/N-acetylgalactosamine-specific phosphotransferase system component IIC